MGRDKDLNKAKGYFKTTYSPVKGMQRGGYYFSLENYHISSNDCHIEVLFDDIQERLIELIKSYEVAVGCIAWLTNFDVLKALETCEWVNIVVQKEDFLRNDSKDNYNNWSRRLKNAYEKLRGKFLTMNIPDTSLGHPHFNKRVQECCVSMSGLWVHGDESIRCVGYSGDTKGNVIPKMHHKFLVLGYADEEVDIIPSLVWTGSYNITQNAEKSRENAVIIRNRKIIHSYLSEWAQLWAVSESLILEKHRTRKSYYLCWNIN